MSEFIKMKDLVGNQFTVQKVVKYSFKMWDTVSNTMRVSDTYVADHRKVYTVETDKGVLDISATQFGSMLEGVSRDGRSDIVHQTFSVKSNGKTGIDIRYWINPVRDAPVAPKPVSDPNIDEVFGVPEEPISLDDIPFG